MPHSPYFVAMFAAPPSRSSQTGIGFDTSGSWPPDASPSKRQKTSESAYKARRHHDGYGYGYGYGCGYESEDQHEDTAGVDANKNQNGPSNSNHRCQCHDDTRPTSRSDRRTRPDVSREKLTRDLRKLETSLDEERRKSAWLEKRVVELERNRPT